MIREEEKIILTCNILTEFINNFGHFLEILGVENLNKESGDLEDFILFEAKKFKSSAYHPEGKMTDLEKIKILKNILSAQIKWYMKHVNDIDLLYDETIDKFANLSKGEAMEIIETLVKE